MDLCEKDTARWESEDAITRDGARRQIRDEAHDIVVLTGRAVEIRSADGIVLDVVEPEAVSS